MRDIVLYAVGATLVAATALVTLFAIPGVLGTVNGTGKPMAVIAQAERAQAAQLEQFGGGK